MAAPSAVVSSFSGTVSRVSLPAPLIIVSQSWPSALIVAHSLGLSVGQVFLKDTVLPYFREVLEHLSVKALNLSHFHRVPLAWPAVVVILGSQAFFQQHQLRLQDYTNVIWLFEQWFMGCRYQQCRKRLCEVSRFCRSINMTTV